MNIINRLFRNIPIPDQHKLGKPEIAPDDAKHKYVAGKIAQVTLVQEREMTFPVHQKHYEGDYDGRMMKGSHKIPDGKNRTVPVGIDGHDPVDHGKGKGNDEI